MRRGTATGVGDSGSTAAEEKKQQDEEDDDEVYQYPKTGLGPAFASIESILRCAICGGLSDPPVALPCCQQAFCSLCIRQYLNCTTPRCPCCRSPSAANKLQMSKELRSICAIWKKHRSAILAGANASAETADAAAATAERHGTTATPTVEEEGAPSGRRRGRAVGNGQGKDGRGSLPKVFYHSLSESQLKKKLTEAGLPTGGGKDAMTARHRRLAVLDAANNDREFPLKRRELIRQVASWENEKNKEKQASAKAAKSAAGGFLTAQVAGSGSGTRPAGRPAGEGAGSEASTPPEAEKFVIPKNMQAGFSALIANVRKSAKKRPSPSASADGGDGGGSTSGGGDGGDGANASDSKKARLSQGPGNASRAGAGADDSAGSDVVGAARSNSSTGGDLCRNGGEGALGGSAEGADVGAEMQILGVAGRMVRTRGPWRCVFSNGGRGNSTAPAAAAAAAAAIAAAGAPATAGGAQATEGDGREQEERRGPLTSAAVTVRGEGSVRSNGSAGGRYEGAGSPAPLVADGRAGGSAGAGDRRDGEVVEGVKLGDSHEEMHAAIAAAAPAVAEAPAEALLSEEGVVYLNTSTGETAREPPAELVIQAEAAAKAGDYLVFVPSRAFVPAAAAAAAAASRVSRAASAVEAAAEGVLQVVGESYQASVEEEAAQRKACNGGGSGAGNGGPAWEAADQHRGREKGAGAGAGAGAKRDKRGLEAPTPPTATKVEVAAVGTGSVGSQSGSGVRDGEETWDRLSSLTMVDLSQGAASAPLDLDGAGGVADGSADGGATGGVEVVTTAMAAAPPAVWTCGACTLVNKARRNTCEVCGSSRPSQQVAQPSSSSSAAESGSANRRRAGSGSKLRLPRRNGKAPQSSITSFTSRGGGESNESQHDDSRAALSAAAPAAGGAAGGAGAAKGASSAASVPPPSQAFSLTSAAPPTNGFPAVRYQEPSLPAAAAATSAAIPASAKKNAAAVVTVGCGGCSPFVRIHPELVF